MQHQNRADAHYQLNMRNICAEHSYRKVRTAYSVVCNLTCEIINLAIDLPLPNMVRGQENAVSN